MQQRLNRQALGIFSVLVQNNFSTLSSFWFPRFVFVDVFCMPTEFILWLGSICADVTCLCHLLTEFSCGSNESQTNPKQYQREPTQVQTKVAKYLQNEGLPNCLR